MALSNRVMAGSAWVIGFRFANKLFAAVQLIVLARLLVPDQFGLFAIASMTLLGFDVLTRTGFNDAIIYKRGNIESYLHTAFMIQVARGLLLAGVVIVCAKYVATFFNEPVAAEVITVLAVIQIVRGFRSLGIVLLARDINFRSEASYLTTGNFVSVAATLILAWILRDVWCLVYGAIIGEIWLTASSYFVHPYRPKLYFSFEKAKELIRFGIWLFLAGVVSYISLQADNIAVGKLLSTESLGVYYMAFRVSNLFVEEVSKPIGRVLQPAYATLQNEPDRLRLALEKAATVFLVVLTPIAAFLMCSAWVTIPLVLGAKWLKVTEIFSILLLGAFFRGFAGVARGFFVGTGKPKVEFWTEAVRAASLLVTLYPLFLSFGMEGIAWAATISSGLKFLLVLWLLLAIIRVRLFLRREVVPVTLATGTMSIVLSYESTLLQQTWVGFLVLLISSAVVFSTVLWLCSPRNAHTGIIKQMVSKGLGRVLRSLGGAFQSRG